MMEINPHYSNREQTDKLNVIDARWVDTTSGLFIDITTARYNSTHPSGEGMLSCKDGHEYRDTYIFPLRETFFEGTPAKIPFAYKEVLEAEYKQKALTLVDFEGHHFDEDKLEWIPVNKKYIADAKNKADEKKAKAQEEQKKEKLAQDKKAEEQKNQGQQALGEPGKQAPVAPEQQPETNQAEPPKPDGPQVVKQPTKADQLPPPEQQNVDAQKAKEEEARIATLKAGEEERKVKEAAGREQEQERQGGKR